MRHQLSLSRLALAAVTLGLVACAESPKKEVPASVRESAPGGSGSGASREGEGSAVSSGVTAFGVPECDTYVRQFTLCVEGNVTGEEKERLLGAFEANRSKWRALGAVPQGAVALNLACKAAAQKAREELSVEYGCQF